jgi:proline utilization trans-activator
MPRRDKGDGSIPRKRALVSCDRCKVRRARCIRENADEICADCRISGVHCESKLPRKQRVYGSVETLSLRYRALEALVKGLFPEENVQDTNVIFTLASARKIPMPASDDYTPADIFHSTSQRPLPAQQPHLQDYQQTATQARQQSQPLPQVGKHPIRSSSTSSLGSTTKASHHNPFSEVQSHSPQAAELISTRHGVPHYFGPSSSFRLATTIRSLSARCKALQGTYFSKLSRPDSSHYTSASQIPTLGRPTSTNPSDEEYTIPDQVETQSPTRAQQKLPKPKVGADGPWERADSSPIADLLPSRSLADALVSAYFDHVHMFLPLFHRSIFQYQMEATYSRQSEILGQCKDIGWLVCLALVFAFGCEQLHEHDPGQAHTLRLKYLDFAKAYFRKLLTTTSLANVQALMLLNLHHDNLGQKSTSWLLVGVGARMASDTLKVIEKKLTYITQAITMGMHRDGSNKEFDPIERNTRRQVWFSIYILEKILCSVLGRPTVIDDSEMTVRLPDASMLEQQSVSAAFMERTFQISQMSYRMRQRAYFDASTAEGELPRIRWYVRHTLILHVFRAISTTQSGSEPPSRMRRVLLDAPT